MKKIFTVLLSLILSVVFFGQSLSAHVLSPNDIEDTVSCELLLTIGSHSYISNSDNENWLEFYFENEEYPFYAFGQSYWYGGEQTLSLLLPVGVPIRVLWHNPDPVNNSVYFTIVDPSTQHVVSSKYNGQVVADGQIATYTPDCGASCGEGDRCPLHISLGRTPNSSNTAYSVDVYLDGYNYVYTTLSIEPSESHLDTTLYICPERQVIVNSGQGGPDFTCTITDAFGRVTETNEWPNYSNHNACAEQCDLLLQIGANAYLSNISNPDWLLIYAGGDEYPIYDYYRTSCYYPNETVTIPVSAGVPLRFVWAEPDATNHNSWFNIIDPSTQQVVFSKYNGQMLADGEIATYTPNCSNTCQEEDKCPLQISLTRTPYSNYNTYEFEVQVDGLPYATFLLDFWQDRLDTTLLFCPEQKVEMRMAQGGNDFGCSVTDPFGNISESSGSFYYVNRNVCAQRCMLLMEIGVQNYQSGDYTPWIEVYEGNDTLPSFSYTGNGAGTHTLIVPVTSGMPLRFVWHEPDPNTSNSWCTLYSPSAEILFEKQRNSFIGDGVFLNITTHCDNAGDGGHVYVTPTGSGSGSSWDDALSSIKEAMIVALNAKADVWVAAGTYYGDTSPTSENAFMMLEGVNVYGGFAGNEPANIDLLQRDLMTNKTVLDGQNVRRVLASGYFNTATLWDGFTIQHGRNYAGAGVFLSNNARISHCSIINNQCTYVGGGGGVYVVHGSVSNCLIANNTAYWGSGMVAEYSSVSNSTIVRNGGGSSSVSCTQAMLVNSIVWGNENTDGTPSNISGSVTCSYSAIEGGCSGDSIVTLSDENPPLFVTHSLTAGAGDSTTNVDWHLQQGSPCINVGDNSVVTDSVDLDGNLRVKEGRVDMGCYEYDPNIVPITNYDSIIYVTVTGAGNHSGINWANATSSIDTAQTLAQEHNAVVWVAAGVYYGDTLSDNAFTMVEGVNVYGGFAGNEPADYDLSLRDFEVNETILDGDSARRVLYQPDNFNMEVMWNGFSICNGQTSGSGAGAYLLQKGRLSQCRVRNNNSINGNGGGVYCSSAEVDECAILGNTCRNDGGGIYATYSTLSDCEIEGNTTTNSGSYGGGVYVSYSMVKGCYITNNTGDNGGGIYLHRGSTMAQCEVTGNVSSSRGGGVFSTSSYWGDGNTLSRSLVAHNRANYGGGIYGSCVHVQNCLVSNNTASSNGGGLYLNQTCTVRNTTVARNASGNDGAGIYGGSGTNLTNCIVWGNEFNGVANNLNGSSIVCSHSAVEGGYSGVDMVLLDNEVNNPMFVNPSLLSGTTDSTLSVDWHLMSSSLCVNRGDNSVVTDSLDLNGTARIKRDTVDMGCYESDYSSAPMQEYDSIIYVTVTGAGTHTGNSWENATSSVESALALAQTYNAMVWVAAGTYYGDTISANAFTMRDGVNVYGGFVGDEPASYDLSMRDLEANVTTLDGQNARRVLYQPFEFNKQTLWDGFTIQNGQTSGNGAGVYLQNRGLLSQCKVQGNISTNGSGGGVYCSSAEVGECNIVGNTCRYDGGGVYATYSTLSECEIEGNTTTNSGSYGGGVYVSYSMVKGCHITNNTGHNGGGIYLHRGSTMDQCEVTGNVSSSSGGGVFSTSSYWGDGNTLVNSMISYNSGAIGGGVYGNNVNVRNSLVSNNTASSSGGGLYLSQSCTVRNTTVTRNASGNDGAGMYSGSGTTLTNCIVWGNELNGVANNLNGSSIVCSHSAVEGGYSGTNMVLLDNGVNSPMFVNPSLLSGTTDSTLSVDWHLMSSSPCVNRGDNSVVTDSLDLDGTARIKRDTVDLGCYESDYYSAPMLEYDSIIYVTVTGAGTHSGNSWENAISSIDSAQALAQTYNAVVWVAAGTYFGDTTSISENAFVMRDGVCVYGGFAGDEPADYDLTLRDFEANASVLDGGNMRRVLYQPYDFGTKVTWEGFTIRYGRTSGNGGGVYLRNNGMLSHSKVMGCMAGNGGGVYSSEGILSECVVSSCAAGNGGGVNCANTIMSSCRITDNTSTASGGGVYSYNSNLVDCDIVENEASNSGGGVYCFYFTGTFSYNVQPTKLIRCKISGNHSIYNGGGVCMGYGNDQLSSCLVSNNASNMIGGGVYGKGHLYNTTVVRNTSIGDGAGVNGSGSTTLQNCIVWGNKRNEVANNLNGSSIVCSYSAVEGGYPGTEMVVLGNGENSPLFANPSETAGVDDVTANVDWHLLQGSPCINRGDNSVATDSLDLDGTARIKRDTVDLGCYESDYQSVIVTDYDGIIYVTVSGSGTHSGNSWANATSSIEEAQGLAQTHNAVVWVAAGTYYGDTTAANAFTMHDGVRVYGGFIGDEPADYDLSLRDFETNVTILDGQNTRRVLYQPFDFNAEATWDGFTIQDGRASEDGAGVYIQRWGRLSKCRVQNNISTNGRGGGVCCSNATVDNCDIVGNTSWTSGGGIFATSASVIKGSRVSGNATTSISGSYNGGGGIYAHSSEINNCVMSNNTSASAGGGAYTYNARIAQCDIIGNTAANDGGGIYSQYAIGIFYSVAPTIITSSRITNNYATGDGGGIRMGYYDDKVTDCLIANNTSGYASGGISGKGSLVNATVVNNLSTGSGSGVYGDISLINCIVWGNKKLGLPNNLNINSINCLYSAIEGGHVGEGNVTLDSSNVGSLYSPCFVNPTVGIGAAYDNGDWHLLPNSVCVNTGSPDSTVISETDLDGQPRMQYGRVDIGCYEYGGAHIVDSVILTVLSDNVMRGNVSGGGLYNLGDTVLLRAVPNEYAKFLRWSDNDTTNPRYVVAERDTTFVAIFDLLLPELHVTSMYYPDLIGGEPAAISWTVQNDGTASTPDGEVWYDRIWLSLEPKVNTSTSIPILLGTFPNVSALAPNEAYTQAETVGIPTQITGEYYLFVTTDAYSVNPIFWEDSVEIPYDPPAYIAALSQGCNGYDCGNYAGNRIFEISEYDHYSDYPYYHDNFYYAQTEVTIPKFPDLLVSSIAPIQHTSFSGFDVPISFGVSNVGAYHTRVSQWTDVVFVSNHNEFDETARMLLTISHQGLLMQDSAYVVDTVVRLPMDFHGTAWFYVQTDYYDQVNEHIWSYNNVERSDSVNVVLLPPADLVPRNITADNTVSTGANFHFSYEVLNQGAGNPNQNAWVDRCYLSTDANELVNAVQIAEDWHYNGLSAGDAYPISHTLILPSNLTEGTYYLFVYADAENNVFEYLNDDNNLVRFDQPIAVVQPDLQILTLNVADTLHAGAEASVSYLLANTGNGAVINQNVTDAFFLSQMPDGVDAITLPLYTHNTWLNAHDSILNYRNVLLPNDLQDGVYFLFAQTNYNNAYMNNVVNEANANNNRSPIKQVYVNHQLLPDILITSVSLPDTITAGYPATITANLNNLGETASSLNNIAFRLSAVSDNHEILCPVVNVTADTQLLDVGSAVAVTLTAVISPALSSDPTSFTLMVNPEHTILETNYSNNGYSFSHAVQPYPFDLKASQLSSPNESISGEYISVSWIVENIGTVPTETQPMYLRQDTTYITVTSELLPIRWYDKVYLSQDSAFDDADVEIGSYIRHYVLRAGDSYTANVNCQLPVAFGGNCYILVVSDATNVTFDSQRANNVVVHPISVIQSPLSDLRMDSLLVSNTLTTGVTYKIRYAVSNIGEHVTHGDHWTDALYLNYQPTLEDAILLGSKYHYNPLGINAQYFDSMNVTIPNTWTGVCYLMGYTDVTSQVVEMDDYSNNLFVLPVFLTSPLSSDLTVFPPNIPQSAMVGEDIQVSWTLQNIGLNAAQGLIKDAVYLSADSIWSNDDVLLGTVQYDIDLAANGQLLRSDTLSLQGVPSGDYFVVVRTNILNALNEDSYTNNKAVSLMKMHVDYPSLYIDQEQQRELNHGQSVYYKLEVGPEYANQTLSCKMVSQSTNVANGLYVAFSSAPSASTFDWSATMPFERNQEILIPSLEQGVYYIMARGQTSDSSSQSVTLLASIVHFEILSISPNRGNNTGSVTTRIVGAQFDTIMDFRLARSNSYLPAEKVFFHNSTESYATFNLRGQMTGPYDVVAELPGGVITVKGQSFRVESEMPAALHAAIPMPESVRLGDIFTVAIGYGNDGFSDLDISGFVVTSNGYPIAWSSEGLADNAIELFFETGEPNANPDVMAPGFSGSKNIVVFASHLGEIELKLYPIRRQY